MSEILEMTQQTAVSSIGSSDRLYVESGGRLRPVTLDTLAKAVRETVRVGGRNLILNSRTFGNQANDEEYMGFGVATAKEWGHNYLILSQTVKKGETLTLSYYARNTSYIGCILKEIGNDNGEWRHIVETFNAPTDMSQIRVVRPVMPNNRDGYTSLCGIKLERGNIATDWTPAPEDLESAKSGGGKSLHLLCRMAERRCAA